MVSAISNFFKSDLCLSSKPSFLVTQGRLTHEERLRALKLPSLKNMRLRNELVSTHRIIGGKIYQEAASYQEGQCNSYSLLGCPIKKWEPIEDEALF